MVSFGENLKKERVSRGISLQEISEYTKIGVRQLQAIEDEQPDQLPGGMFNKSFVRQYARYLGLDEEQTVADYMQAFGIAEASVPAPRALPEEKPLPASAGYPRLILTAICLGIAVAGISFAIHRVTESHKAREAAAAASVQPATVPVETPNALSYPTSPANPLETNSVPSANPLSPPVAPLPDMPATVGAPGTAAAPSSLTAVQDQLPKPQSAVATLTRPNPPVAPSTAVEKPSTVAAADAAAGSLLLQIDARKEVWLSITADGQKQWQGVLQAEKTRRVQARESVKLTVGDAGAVALTLNGKLLPSVGKPGEVRNLNISAKGLAEPAP